MERSFTGFSSRVSRDLSRDSLRDLLMGSPRFMQGFFQQCLMGFAMGSLREFFLVGLPNDPLPFYGQILTREN